MSKILTIAYNDLLVYLKNQGTAVFMIVMPIVMAGFIGLGLSGAGDGPTQIRVDVFDNDQTPLSEQFLKDLRQANNSLVLCPFDNDEDDFCRLKDKPELTSEAATKRVSENTSLAAIEIPAGFAAKLTANEPVNIIYRSNENAAAPSYILQAVQAVTQRMSAATVAASVGVNVAADFKALQFKDEADKTAFRQSVYDRATKTWETNPVKVDFQLSAKENTRTTSGTQSGFGQSIPGISSMFVLFAVMVGIFNILNERKNWTLQRLVMMPVSRGQILAGKILMYFCLGMIQYIIVFGAGYVFTLVIGRLNGSGATVSYGNDPIALVLVMAAFSLCSTALTFAIAPMMRNEFQASAVVNLLGLSLAPLGGAWWPLDIVPPIMRTIGHISPVAWAMDGFNSLIFENGSLGTVIIPILVLLAMSAVFFAFGVTRFKYE
jgi:ABC-2 type transport system permease protein